MGKKKTTIKTVPVKIRKTWGINPVERVKDDKKKYNRRQEKEKFKKAEKDLGENDS